MGPLTVIIVWKPTFVAGDGALQEKSDMCDAGRVKKQGPQTEQEVGGQQSKRSNLQRDTCEGGCLRANLLRGGAHVIIYLITYIMTFCRHTLVSCNHCHTHTFCMHAYMIRVGPRVMAKSERLLHMLFVQYDIK